MLNTLTTAQLQQFVKYTVASSCGLRTTPAAVPRTILCQQTPLLLSKKNYSYAANGKSIHFTPWMLARTRS
jgi:hypothetical protein